MKTELLPTGAPGELAAAVERAVAALRAGDTVAVPTETVYGLAADALNPSAVAKIFDAKERPRFDPLIVHLPDRKWLAQITSIPADAQPLVHALTERFWPGPLTLALPRHDIVPDIVTAGLETVAVRMSAHPILAEILRILDRPVAAPSANRFGRISPTAAAHVAMELSGRISLIIDGGSTDHGVESTIVAVGGDGMRLLRQGPITAEQLSGFGKVAESRSTHIEAPGQLASHYAPATPLVIVGEASSYARRERRCGLLAWKATRAAAAEFTEVRQLSSRQDLREAAANLFRMMRELDGASLDLIVAEAVPEQGIGAAIMDRLRRAAARR